MPKCLACGQFLAAAAAATCTSCPAIYHRGCVSISATASLSKDWTCPECKKKVRRGDNSGTPVRGVCEGLVQGAVPPTVTASAGLSPPAEASLVAAADSVRELRRELAECVAEMREFRRELAENRVLVAGVAARMDSVEQRLEALEQREAAPPASSADVTELERTVAQLRQELGDRDQEALLADLEIGHLPEVRGENVVHAVTSLSARLGVALEERDIVFAERVGAAPAAEGPAVRERRVVVRLARRSLRDDLLRAARARRTLSADAGGSGAGAPRGRIFLNERLTRANRQLFYRVREECRKRQWRYSWTRRGRVFAREADGKPFHQFRSDADIVRIFR